MEKTISIRTLANSSAAAQRSTREQLRRKLAALAAVGVVGLASLAGAGFGSGAAHAESVQADGFRSISLNQTVAAGQAETVTAITNIPADTMNNLPRVQWGDGSEMVPSVKLVKSGDALVTQLSATHTYQQPGTPTIIVSYFPTLGGSAINANLPITVTAATNNQPAAPATIAVPTGFRQVTADQNLRVGQAGQLSALTVFLSDPNRFARVQWGDGTEMVPTVTSRKAGDALVSQISAVHAYQKAGSYTIVLSYFPNTGGAPFSANIQVNVSIPPQPRQTQPAPEQHPTGPFAGLQFAALNFGPLHQLFNGSDHFYTTDANEYAAALQQGYTDEGASAEISMAPADGLTPLFRLNVNGDHIYTIDQGEHDRLVAGGATDEGIACFVRVEAD